MSCAAASLQSCPNAALLRAIARAGGGEVDDCEPPKPESKISLRGDIHSVGIGTAVPDLLRHLVEQTLVHRLSASVEVEYTADTAHKLLPLFFI